MKRKKPWKEFKHMEWEEMKKEIINTYGEEWLKELGRLIVEGDANQKDI